MRLGFFFFADATCKKAGGREGGGTSKERRGEKSDPRRDRRGRGPMLRLPSGTQSSVRVSQIWQWSQMRLVLHGHDRGGHLSQSSFAAAHFRRQQALLALR